MEWISVNDRLPEDDTYVLVAYKWKRGNPDEIAFDVESRQYGDWEFRGEHCSDTITHWMPLPSPPKTMTEAEQIEEVRKGRT